MASGSLPLPAAATLAQGLRTRSRAPGYRRSPCLAVAFGVLPADRRGLPVRGGPDPVPGPEPGGARAQSADRLCRPALAGLGRIHGRRRLCRLQSRTARPRPAAAGQLLPGRPGRRRRRPCLRRAQSSAARVLPRRLDAGRAVLPAMVAHQVRLVLELQRVGRHLGAAAADRRARPEHADRPLPARAVHRRRSDHRGDPRSSHRRWAASSSPCATTRSRPRSSGCRCCG